ncbi:hypothetical protein, partial [Mediterraneibacter sp.]
NFNTNGKTRNLLARCIKTTSRKISAGRKNLYFFNCLLDGEQFKELHWHWSMQLLLVISQY